MQCQNCKQHTATIHLTEISNGRRQETHLCELCAQRQGLAVKSQIPLNELLSTLLATQAEAIDKTPDPDDTAIENVCPSCGMTLKKFRKTGLLGCPYDYEVFGERLRLVVEKSHGGSSEHCGKVPSRAPTDAKKRIEIMKLRSRLEHAVKSEDYETAAKLRDKIEKLQ